MSLLKAPGGDGVPDWEGWVGAERSVCPPLYLGAARGSPRLYRMER